MGCDIHVQVERRHPKRRQWVHLCPPLIRDFYNRYHQHWYTGRGYHTFAYLAGVRGPEGPIEPRGWPADAAEHTRILYDDYGRDAHTPSWWTLAELHQHFDDQMDEHVSMSRLIRTLDQIATDGDDRLGEPTPHDDIRIVFFFDN